MLGSDAGCLSRRTEWLAKQSFLRNRLTLLNEATPPKISSTVTNHHNDVEVPIYKFGLELHDMLNSRPSHGNSCSSKALAAFNTSPMHAMQLHQRQNLESSADTFAAW
jgi:hypothetical protein